MRDLSPLLISRKGTISGAVLEGRPDVSLEGIRRGQTLQWSITFGGTTQRLRCVESRKGRG